MDVRSWVPGGTSSLQKAELNKKRKMIEWVSRDAEKMRGVGQAGLEGLALVAKAGSHVLLFTRL